MRFVDIHPLLSSDLFVENQCRNFYQPGQVEVKIERIFREVRLKTDRQWQTPTQSRSMHIVSTGDSKLALSV